MEAGALSLLPAAVAIGLALVTRQVIPALLAATWTGGTLLAGGHPVDGLLRVFDPLVVDAIADRDHVKVTLFSVLVGATVGILGASGATGALVGLLARRAATPRRAATGAWLAGLAVFFDDYANCLVVGHAARPVCDRVGISRARLAYIVDSTAAPIASIALISTWVGYEVGLLEDALRAAGQDLDAYAFFVAGIPYRFYCILALLFVGLTALTGREFGPMLEVERQARSGRDPSRAVTPDPAPDDAPPGRAALAVVALAALVGGAASSLWLQGRAAAGPGASLLQVLAAADGYDAMLRASIAASVLAGGGAVLTRMLTLREAVEAGLKGMTSLLEALVVLWLAWALGSCVDQLDAAGFLVGALGDALPAWSLPTLVFLVAAATSFATGTSFGTMAVMVPIAVPLGFGMAAPPTLPLAVSGAVLAGACWGDHCSPISDTTVLSSLGAGCDHAVHVRTQLPYALVVGGLSVVFGTLPAGLGVPAWVGLLLATAASVALLRLVGRHPDGTARPTGRRPAGTEPADPGRRAVSSS